LGIRESHLGQGEVPMRILVTGAEGYIGSLMTQVLSQAGHEVTGVDAGFFTEGLLYPMPVKQATLIKDIRDLTVMELSAFEAVVHLAELSNDPMGQLNPAMTMILNHQGSVELAKRCREAGVSRFLYSSSCSVYGVGNEEWKTEESETAPKTTYALCKTLVETDVALLATSNFSPVFLRNATAFGISPRMRFDLVLNNLAALSYLTGTVRMTSDGCPWRPLVHIRDICGAFSAVLAAPRELTHAQIINVGSDNCNYRVKDIAKIVGQVFQARDISFGHSDQDQRSYRVSFTKIKNLFPEYVFEMNADNGAEELLTHFMAIGLNQSKFEESPFTRVRHLEKLLMNGRLDSGLRWSTQ